MASTEELEKQLHEAEERRRKSSESTIEALQTNIECLEEQLKESNMVIERANSLVERLVERSREHRQKDSELYNRLFEILPSVAAKVKKHDSS
jgi:cell division septum initiation protein DivIVA